jgi:hypothetical protein
MTQVYKKEIGGFTRIPANAQVWVLTGTQPYTGADPSGTGAIRDGDYGFLSTSTGPIILRYKAACTRAAAAGGGTTSVWMSPLAYDGTPILEAWTDGTETNSTLLNQGWTLVNDSNCTVAPVSGFQRLSSTPLAASARLRCLSGSVTSTTRFELLFEARASTAGSSTLALPVVLGDGTSGTAFGQVGAQGLGFKDFAFSGPLQNPQRNAGAQSLPALASTASICLVRDEGRTVYNSAIVNGLPFASYLRSSQSTSFNGFQLSAQGQSGVAATLDYRGQVITY